MNKFDRYLDSLMELPTWIGFPIFVASIIIPLSLTLLTILFLVLAASPWFLLTPVVIWAACAINWWLKNR